MVFTLWSTNSLLLKIDIEIVDLHGFLPIHSMVDLSSVQTVEFITRPGSHPIQLTIFVGEKSQEKPPWIPNLGPTSSN